MVFKRGLQACPGGACGWMGDEVPSPLGDTGPWGAGNKKGFLLCTPPWLLGGLGSPEVEITTFLPLWVGHFAPR